MSSIALARLQREYKDVMTNQEIQETGIRIEMMNDRLTDIKGSIRGPPDTPYEGGSFELTVKVPSSYPFSPPKVQFVTRIWHPNISSQTGTICLDILASEWAATLTLRTVLLSVQALLASPEPNDPQDAVVAKQYMEKHALYKDTASYWTWKYANGPAAPAKKYVDKVEKMVNAGYYEDDALSALSNANWLMTKAKKLL